MKKLILFLILGVFCLTLIACGNVAPNGPGKLDTTTANEEEGYPPPPPPGGGNGG